MINKTAYYLLT